MKEFLKILEEIQKFLEGTQACPATALSTSSKIRTSLLMMVDATKQQRMKVVFLGNTSNGKSTVINALVKREVLPVGKGSVSSCFCTITGIPPSEGGDTYVKIGDRQEELAVRLRPRVHINLCTIGTVGSIFNSWEDWLASISCCGTTNLSCMLFFCMSLNHFAESEEIVQLHESYKPPG